MRNTVEKNTTRHREIQLAGEGRGELDTSRSALYSATLPCPTSYIGNVNSVRLNSTQIDSKPDTTASSHYFPLIHSMLAAGMLDTNILEEI